MLVSDSLIHREDARGVLTGPGRHSGRPKASAPPAERAGGPTRPALRSPASRQPDAPQGRVGNPPRGLHGDGPQKTTWGVAPTRKDGLACLRKLESTFLSQSRLSSFSLSFIGDSNKCFKPNLEQLVFQKLLEHKENSSFGTISK